MGRMPLLELLLQFQARYLSAHTAQSSCLTWNLVAWPLHMQLPAEQQNVLCLSQASVNASSMPVPIDVGYGQAPSRVQQRLAEQARELH